MLRCGSIAIQRYLISIPQPTNKRSISQQLSECNPVFNTHKWSHRCRASLAATHQSQTFCQHCGAGGSRPALRWPLELLQDTGAVRLPEAAMEGGLTPPRNSGPVPGAGGVNGERDGEGERRKRTGGRPGSSVCRYPAYGSRYELPGASWQTELCGPPKCAVLSQVPGVENSATVAGTECSAKTAARWWCT